MITANKLQHGLSLIELMVTLAVVAVISVTTVPAMNSFVVKQELRNAQEDVATVLRKAKHLSRTQNTNIRVAFTNASNSVQLILPNDDVMQTLTLDKVAADVTITFQFNAFGTVAPLGTVNLVSERDANRSKAVTISTLFGQVTLS